MKKRTQKTELRASIRQVAERAGVSPMTVTNVLRYRDRVAEETQKKVLEAVEALNYIPVRSTMQNRHVATNAIGLLFHQDMQGAVGYPTFMGICEEAQAHDHDINIVLRATPDWVRPGVEVQFLDRRCDGFIFVGDDRPELSEALIRHQVPVVECYSPDPPEGVGSVVGNNAQGIHLAVAHLVKQGHRRIAHLAGPEFKREARIRRDAFCEAMHELTGYDGADWIVQADSWGDLWGCNYVGDPGEKSRPLAEAVLKLDVTAVVCANDQLALAVWKMALQKGLRVPEDFSITGMDNINEAALQGLTTIAQPFHEIGKAAVDAVLALIAGADSKSVSQVLPVELIQRRTVAPPPEKPRQFTV